jgi:hypothetical protein
MDIRAQWVACRDPNLLPTEERASAHESTILRKAFGWQARIYTNNSARFWHAEKFADKRRPYVAKAIHRGFNRKYG